MTRKVVMVALIAALAACNSELDAMTPGTPDSGVPDAGTPDSSVPPPRDNCTDGVDCLCDTIGQTDPGVVFCADFEDPTLDQNGGSGWVEAYNEPNESCWSSNGTSDWRHTVEGTCPTCCVNVVKESACEVSGQTDCVFQGTQTFGHRFRPGEVGGFVGYRDIATGANFGITMAVKYSRNYVNGQTPKKTNQFGRGNHCILGCSSGTYLSRTKGSPFHGLIFWNGGAAPQWTDVVGRGSYSGVAFGWYPTDDWDFDRDHGLDEWHCWRLHIANVGRDGATIRHWMDNRLMVHLKDVDLRGMVDATTGFDGFGFNNYYNEGYQGSSVAYRYEDNMVITIGPEPISCEAIGFSDEMLGGSR